MPSCHDMKDARHGRDPQRLVDGRPQLLPGPDGLRDGQGRAGAPDDVGRAPAAAARHRGEHVPHRRARRVGRLRVQPPRRRHSDWEPSGGRGRRHRLDARAAARPTRATTWAWPNSAPSTASWRHAVERVPHHQQSALGRHAPTCARSTTATSRAARRSSPCPGRRRRTSSRGRSACRRSAGR